MRSLVSLLVIFDYLFTTSARNSVKNFKESEIPIIIGKCEYILSIEQNNEEHNREVKVAAKTLYELAEIVEIKPHVSPNRTYIDLLFLSADGGNTRSQHKLATMLATGVGRNHLFPMDAGLSLIYEYNSALGGEPEAAMGLGYRFLKGIGMAENCESALPFYQYAADIAVDFLSKNAYMNPDNAKLSETTDRNNIWFRNEVNEELVDYYASIAKNGDISAAMTLGNIYSQGTRRIYPDMEKAVYFLTIAADLKHVAAIGKLGYLLAKWYRQIHSQEEGHEHDPDHDPDGESAEERWTKTGKVSVEHIVELVNFGAARGDFNANVAQGLLYYHGIGVEKDAVKATEIFQKFMSLHADAGFYLGELYMHAGSQIELDRSKRSGKNNQYIINAFRSYTISAGLGNALSQHRIGHMTVNSLGTNRNCNAAAAHFRSVAEKGVWSHSLSRAHELYSSGKRHAALFEFSKMAAIGYESAQFNVAFILSKGISCPPLISLNSDPLEPPQPEEVVKTSSSSPSSVFALLSLSNSSMVDDECEKRAVMLFGLSAYEKSPDSYLQLGDYYYYKGAGAVGGSSSSSSSGGVLDTQVEVKNTNKEAATYYQKAADLRQAHALFNLGLMYEAGDGVIQDFHLAKRYYDMAAEVDHRAKIPRDIAVWILGSHQSLLEYPWAQSFFQTISIADVVSTCSEIDGAIRWVLTSLSYVFPFLDRKRRPLIMMIDDYTNSYADEESMAAWKKVWPLDVILKFATMLHVQFEEFKKEFKNFKFMEFNLDFNLSFTEIKMEDVARPWDIFTSVVIEEQEVTALLTLFIIFLALSLLKMYRRRVNLGERPALLVPANI